MDKKEDILKKHCPSMDVLFLDQQGRAFRDRIFSAMKEYAAECCQATLELAKENTICFINSDDCGRIETEDYYNILEFIESKNNIVLL